MHGEGRLEFFDGVIYEGEFQYNFITGKVNFNNGFLNKTF